MSFKKTLQKSFEVVAGLIYVSAGEPYSIGKETAKYTTANISEKISNQKERKRREKLYRH